MTHDTPTKRIWLLPHDGEQRCWCVDPDPAGTGDASDSTEYTLTSEADAMVAAALRGAADLADTTFSGSGTDAAMVIRHAILASIPQPASAALDKLIAEAVARGMEKAAEICEGIRTGIANGPMPEGARFDYEQAIRAAKGDQT